MSRRLECSSESSAESNAVVVCPQLSGSVGNPLQRLFDLLSAHYGPTHWWPGESPFEVAVGAILVQNTAWSNVELAIANLKRAQLLDAHALLAVPLADVEAAIRPSGYFRVKGKRLLNFVRYLVERYDGEMALLARVPTELLRSELLSIHGIGPETADDILLYACEKRVFVVDAYTRRILSRHGLVDPDIGYEALRAYCEERLPWRVDVYKEFHGLLVFAGKDFCRKSARCGECPLRGMLPGGVPVVEPCAG